MALVLLSNLVSKIGFPRAPITHDCNRRRYLSIRNIQKKSFTISIVRNRRPRKTHLKGRKLNVLFKILEYASQIWSPQLQNQRNRIESIQKQFLLYALRRFKWQHRFQLPSYKHRLLLLQMNTLYDRRIIAQILFIFQLIKGKIKSPPLLNKIGYREYQRVFRTYCMCFLVV